MARTHRGASDSRASALWGTGNRGGEGRSNALWGTGNRGGESRSNALWGSGRGRGFVTLAVSALALALPITAAAGVSSARGDGNGGTYVAPGVLQAAARGEKLDVIIQAAGGVESAKSALQGLGSLKKEFARTGMVSAELPAARIEQLRQRPGLVVTLDAPVKATGYTSTQLWPFLNGVANLWGGPSAPTIAIVDSGIDTSLPSFAGNRVVARQAFGQSGGALDSRGHGSFVAGIAAGGAAGYAGASPGSPLVDLDVIDANGMARTSDVIAAAEWILANKDAHNIRVANFSLHSSSILSIRYHPLNRVVEKLWFSGVVVVAAAGNYGRADGPSGVVHAPGNDPFVLTVGALDLGDRYGRGDNGVASWSAYGYTNEGFAKPEVIAAGRYMVGPVPTASTLPLTRPDKVVAPGYMQLSGTSFAAPVVAGTAAQILARHPEWTPDQVKGALMLTARRVSVGPLLSQGRGEINAYRAATLKTAPVANAPLNRFVVPDTAGGGKVFDAASWADASWADASWDAASWADASWADASWTDASWADASWADASWNDASWADASWADSTAYEDAADGDASKAVPEASPATLDAADDDPSFVLPRPPDGALGSTSPLGTTTTTLLGG